MNGSPSDNYLDKLRELIPARTLSLYVLLVGVVSGFATTAADIVKSYGWALLLVTGVCIAINFFARWLGWFGDKKGLKDAAISSLAFLLLTMTQRATGPLAALGLDSQSVYLVVSIVALLYVYLINLILPKKAAA